MDITYCKIDGGNFGDDLNLLLWPRLFPGLHAVSSGVSFYGIGTLLDGFHDQSHRKVVLGTGLGEVGMAQADASWDFYWVRGPLTAREFGLPASMGIGDPALLWPGLEPIGQVQENAPVGLIPHYRTWDSFDWPEVARQAGMVAINPRQPPQLVIDQMRSCSRILTESLHGGICADAMGIDWAPCVLAHRFNDFKWRDWLATIEREFAPLVLHKPLLRSLSVGKVVGNYLARLTRYKAGTRRPALRAVGCASRQDVGEVSASLRTYASQPANFRCSAPTKIESQRQRMHVLCETFAVRNQLQYNP
ncbi:MAG: hypothetical protein PHQ58_06380 [Rhodoferax sp.]|uniref:polysaccharide pyruvyl transferase family protein n=1 Tax=Rhodoferax sp. TaxID=50421 RepID=UPI002626E1C5|nr:polysaccharide pyruvyl transferase family protein [Rhodoferax sp.]MDD2880044.1 hypothetical protein [Rhodoferax sp.]